LVEGGATSEVSTRRPRRTINLATLNTEHNYSYRTFE
jgi:hypothetical protein